MSISESLDFKARGGFTLIEMLIVISIISLLLSVTATSGTASRRQFLLTTSQEQLRALISRAKSLSVSTILSRSQAICGYGVHVDSSSKRAFIFRDLPAGVRCPGDNKYSKDNPNAEKIGGLLNEMKLDGSLSFNKDLDIVFVPPDPTTYLNGLIDAPDEIIEITVLGGDKRKIKVNSAGLIDLISGK